MTETAKLILTKSNIDVAVLLLIICAFVWIIVLAVVFLVKATRTKKILGAEFDPEKPHSERRAR